MQPPSIEMHKRAHFQPRPTPSPDPGPLRSSTRSPTLVRAMPLFPSHLLRPCHSKPTARRRRRKMRHRHPTSGDAPPEASSHGESNGGRSGGWKTGKFPNPPEAEIPDPATLREQWRYATRQYARWYSSAWGAAILAGGAFFALGWIIKGSNPLPSLQVGGDRPPTSEPDAGESKPRPA